MDLVLYSLLMRLADGGPLYTETQLERFPVEPWNTFSNVVFLATLIYFTRRVWKAPKRTPFTTVILPILAIGFIGGTVFHATRSHNIWLKMDYMPIVILTCAATAFFWRACVGRWWLSVVIMTAGLLSTRYVMKNALLEIGTRIAIGYSSLALLLIVPAFILSAKRQWKDWRLVAGAIFIFMFAIIFRSVDRGVGADVLPMGTHFLWHIFGGASVFLLMLYTVRFEEEDQPVMVDRNPS